MPPLELVSLPGGHGALVVWTVADHDRQSVLRWQALDALGGARGAPGHHLLTQAAVRRLRAITLPDRVGLGWCGPWNTGAPSSGLAYLREGVFHGGMGNADVAPNPFAVAPSAAERRPGCDLALVADGTDGVFATPGSWYRCWSPPLELRTHTGTLFSSGCEPVDGTWPLRRRARATPASMAPPLVLVRTPHRLVVALATGPDRTDTTLHALPPGPSVEEISLRAGTVRAPGQPAPRRRAPTDCRYDDCGASMGTLTAVSARLIWTGDALLVTTMEATGARALWLRDDDPSTTPRLDPATTPLRRVRSAALRCHAGRLRGRVELEGESPREFDPTGSDASFRWTDLLRLTEPSSPPPLAAAWTGEALLVARTRSDEGVGPAERPSLESWRCHADSWRRDD